MKCCSRHRAWSACATSRRTAGAKEGGPVTVLVHGEFNCGDDFYLGIFLNYIKYTYTPEINHLAKEAGNRSCCSVLNASCSISHGPLLATLFGNFSNINGRVNDPKSACLIKNWLSVAAKKEKSKKDMGLDASITALRPDHSAHKESMEGQQSPERGRAQLCRQEAHAKRAEKQSLFSLGRGKKSFQILQI